MRILIIDNTRLYQSLLSELFTRAGALTIQVDDAASGLALCQEQTFDLLCISRRLPDQTGLALLRNIRKHEQYHSVPAILLTADDSDAIRQEGFAAGFMDVINKADMETLRLSIERLVERFTRKIHGHVLYIEDCIAVAAVMCANMEDLGLRVDHYTRGEDGLSAFAEQDYDLVVTDVILEGSISGMGVVNSIRSIEGDKSRTPILAVSGGDDTARRVELLRLGANDYITKPVHAAEFAARISNLIQYKQLFDQVRAQQKQLEKMATTDQLTGLFNRHSLHTLGPKYLSEAKRHQMPLCLLVIDLDHFKSINDVHGHSTGDAVLSAVGQLLKEETRNEDLAARFGGEEFVVLFAHCALEAAVQKANDLRLKLEALQPAGLIVTASIGVATLPLDANIRFEDLFNAADEAVYAAKHTGRNRVCAHAPANPPQADTRPAQ